MQGNEFMVFIFWRTAFLTSRRERGINADNVNDALVCLIGLIVLSNFIGYRLQNIEVTTYSKY